MSSTTPLAQTAGNPLKTRITGGAILYRLFDVGYEIRLDHAYELLASTGPDRSRPVRGEAQAIHIPNPPITVHLWTETVPIGAETQHVQFSARIFDFGVVSLRARLELRATTWDEFVDRGIAVGSSGAWGAFESCRDRLLERLRPAIVRPELSRITEEYIVYRIDRIEDSASGRPIPPDRLPEHDIARLLVGEARPLSPQARGDILSHRFSYFDDDLTVVAWSAALVVESVREDTDVQYVLEFANAQLLELRLYDALLDAELPRIYDEIEAARRGTLLGARRFSRLLSVIQTRVADATEAVERVENSLKVTDDVFLARIYGAVIEVFRAGTWRAGIERKVRIVGDTYSMLNAEAQSRRSELLELIVIVLIVLEILLALFWH
ncbi:MAG TPA: hypothetical protein VFY90_07355 [Tepidiformaceae bacterium]|nr:hypothetical protein [Tepidiformaceae bacterium]